MAPLVGQHDLRLRKCCSAGETLPAATRALWKEATGIEIIDGIGSTEMLHIFISADEEDARPGATRQARARLPRHGDRRGRQPAAPGQVGRLAVKGPTGCRYLDDERQKTYVQNGWNLTGDAYLVDEDGYFVYQARTNDMIISSGYNIAGPEVEAALLLHPKVAECAMMSAAPPRARHDRQGVRGARRRGRLGRAAAKGHPGVRQAPDRTLQIPARHRVPRHPAHSATGKLQRFVLRAAKPAPEKTGA